MDLLKGFVWALALFFAASWTFVAIVQPAGQLKSTFATLPYWWAAIAICWFTDASVFHLFWMMPLALVLPAALAQRSFRQTFGHDSVLGLLMKASVVLGPAYGLLYAMAG